MSHAVRSSVNLICGFRFFQRSKTKADSINFPSDLNVEEFLNKLHYEVK